eukprot:COSAG01_NODE_7989_length_2963_cov_1.356145_2_plen_83_part_01
MTVDIEGIPKHPSLGSTTVIMASGEVGTFGSMESLGMGMRPRKVWVPRNFSRGESRGWCLACACEQYISFHDLLVTLSLFRFS